MQRSLDMENKNEYIEQEEDIPLDYFLQSTSWDI
jgi:hypothetical protein